jgi:thiol-disulfide isomerase/thioredoxin
MPTILSRRPALLATSLTALTLAACGGDSGGDEAGAPPRPVAPSTAGLPAKLAANIKDADKIVGEGEEAFKERLGRLRGHRVVVNQWASWCEPCRFELPFFRSMTARYRKQVAFIGLDMQDQRGAAEDFMRELPSGFPSIFDPDGDVTASLGGGQASPTTFFLDEKGEVINVKIGAYATAELLDKDIRRYALKEG